MWQAQFLHHTLVHKTKNVYFFKMYKRYYYHIFIFLLVSNLEKSLKSFLSRVQSSLLKLSTNLVTTVNILHQVPYEFKKMSRILTYYVDRYIFTIFNSQLKMKTQHDFIKVFTECIYFSLFLYFQIY